jgi:hypothetical protein
MLHERTSPAASRSVPTRGRIPVKRVLIVLGLAVAVAMTAPAASVAAPSFAERLEARKTCLSERGTDAIKRAYFRSLYGGRKPFRRCVRYQIRQARAEAKLEAPLIRAECQMAYNEAPLEFRMEYPGPNPVATCVRMESAP